MPRTAGPRTWLRRTSPAPRPTHHVAGQICSAGWTRKRPPRFQGDPRLRDCRRHQNTRSRRCSGVPGRTKPAGRPCSRSSGNWSRTRKSAIGSPAWSRPWLFAFIDAAGCLAENTCNDRRDRWIRSVSASRAETISGSRRRGDQAGTASTRLSATNSINHLAFIAWFDDVGSVGNPLNVLELAISEAAESIGLGKPDPPAFGTGAVAGWSRLTARSARSRKSGLRHCRRRPAAGDRRAR